MAKQPKCHDCGAATLRVVAVDKGHQFVCTSCEYLREHPDAPRAVKMPNERRPKRLQTETLFDAL